MQSAEPQPHIRLLILGPRAPEEDGLDQLLAQQHAIAVVGKVLEIGNCGESVRLHKPDVTMVRALDVDVALDATRNILARTPSARLLLITHAASADIAVRMLEHGACGLLPPRDVHAQGLRAIHAVYGGEIWGSRALLSGMLQSSIQHTVLVHAREKSASSLTERESEIVKLLRVGASNKQIAAQLRISDKTVKTHLQNIFGKMQIHRRQQILPALRLA